MVLTSFSDANISNNFSGGSLLPGHTVYSTMNCSHFCEHCANISKIILGDILVKKKQCQVWFEQVS